MSCRYFLITKPENGPWSDPVEYSDFFDAWGAVCGDHLNPDLIIACTPRDTAVHSWAIYCMRHGDAKPWLHGGLGRDGDQLPREIELPVRAAA